MVTRGEREWADAARDSAVVRALEAVYADVAQAVAERGPACWASGRCCNFERAGHRLYVTGIEAALALRRDRERAAGDAVQAPGTDVSLPVLRAAASDGPVDQGAIDAARSRGGCPFQVGNLCGAHAFRPLGCRVYFCDRSSQDWQRELYEHAQSAIRDLHERFRIAYVYGEWREVLTAALRADG